MYINFLEMSSGLELHKKANPRAQYGAALWMDTQGSTQLSQVHWSHNVSSWQFWACSVLLQIDPLRKRITTVNISLFTKRITVTRFLIKNCPQWSWLGLYHILFCTPQHLPQCQDKALQISGKMGAGLNGLEHMGSMATLFFWLFDNSSKPQAMWNSSCEKPLRCGFWERCPLNLSYCKTDTVPWFCTVSHALFLKPIYLRHNSNY